MLHDHVNPCMIDRPDGFIYAHNMDPWCRIIHGLGLCLRRERIQEFNAHLTSLSEHHDIPKVYKFDTQRCRTLISLPSSNIFMPSPLKVGPG